MTVQVFQSPVRNLYGTYCSSELLHKLEHEIAVEYQSRFFTNYMRVFDAVDSWIQRCDLLQEKYHYKEYFMDMAKYLTDYLIDHGLVRLMPGECILPCPTKFRPFQTFQTLTDEPCVDNACLIEISDDDDPVPAIPNPCFQNSRPGGTSGSLHQPPIQSRPDGRSSQRGLFGDADDKMEPDSPQRNPGALPITSFSSGVQRNQRPTLTQCFEAARLLRYLPMVGVPRVSQKREGSPMHIWQTWVPRNGRERPTRSFIYAPQTDSAPLLPMIRYLEDCGLDSVMCATLESHLRQSEFQPDQRGRYQF